MFGGGSVHYHDNDDDKDEAAPLSATRPQNVASRWLFLAVLGNDLDTRDQATSRSCSI